MSVHSYELDREVFILLNSQSSKLDDWKGAASGIADYVASWGLERFWAMSRSQVLKGGKNPKSNSPEDKEAKQSYFSWEVARIVLCKIVGNNLRINANMTTEEFQKRLSELDFNQQILLTDLLIEISSTIQFWTMRIADAEEIKRSV